MNLKNRIITVALAATVSTALCVTTANASPIAEVANQGAQTQEIQSLNQLGTIAVAESSLPELLNTIPEQWVRDLVQADFFAAESIDFNGEAARVLPLADEAGPIIDPATMERAVEDIRNGAIAGGIVGAAPGIVAGGITGAYIVGTLGGWYGGLQGGIIGAGLGTLVGGILGCIVGLPYILVGCIVGFPIGAALGGFVGGGVGAAAGGNIGAGAGAVLGTGAGAAAGAALSQPLIDAGGHAGAQIADSWNIIINDLAADNVPANSVVDQPVVEGELVPAQ